MTKCHLCDAEVLSTSQPNRMGTTPEMQKMYDEFGGDDVLRDALGQISGKNDLSGVPDDDLESAARNALYECELIARAALDATLAPGYGGRYGRRPNKETQP